MANPDHTDTRIPRTGGNQAPTYDQNALLQFDQSVASGLGIPLNQVGPQQIADWQASQVDNSFGNFLLNAGELTGEVLGAGALAGAGLGALGYGAEAGVAGGAGAGAGAGVGAGTIGSTAAGDIALTDATAGLADTAGGLAASDAAAAGLGSVGAIGTTPLASAGDIAGSSGMLDPLTVTAPSTAAGGVGDLLGAGSPLLASLGAVPGSVTDIGSTLPSGQPQFLGANDTQPSLQPLSGDMMSQFGIDPGSISTDTSFDSSLAADNPGYGPMDIAGPTTGQGIEKWLSNPRNLSTLASLGISGASALSHPRLPGASQTAQSNATALTKGAIPIIQSGGTATPLWSSQKASIDATIDQQIKQQSQALQQAAINSGMGNQNSGVVQQQIAEMTRQANVQRQELYTQAQQQNVNNALSELSQGDQILAEIGAMQLQQDERAKQLAGQTAELALLLASGASMPRGP
jgi:hypothetical protein